MTTLSGMTGCGKGQNQSSAIKSESKPVHLSPFKDWADDSYKFIEEHHRVQGSNLYHEEEDHGAIAFAWPLGIQLHFLTESGRIQQAEDFAAELHKRYWCYHKDHWGYNAAADACDDRYYDDNSWIAKGLMELYGVTGKDEYLQNAKEIVAFTMSGANINPFGGLRWFEGDTQGSAIITNAPTAVANLLIYKATHEEQYLANAKMLYEWEKSLGHRYGPGARGYETSVLIEVALLLHEITADAHYLQEAQEIGLTNESNYVDPLTHALHETGQWGGHDMTKSYVQLFKADGDVNWLNIAAGYLNYLHENGKDKDGRYVEDWDKPSSNSKVGLLYQSSAARAFATMAASPGGVTKVVEPGILYDDCNFSRIAARFGIGRYTLADLQMRGLKANSVSSIRVAPGYRLTVYENDNFSGKSEVFTSDQACLADSSPLNDHVNSFTIEAIDPKVQIFKDSHYQGRAVALQEGEYSRLDLLAMGFSDHDISSISIADGYEITARRASMDDPNPLVLDKSVDCLDGPWNDSIATITVRKKN